MKAPQNRSRTYKMKGSKNIRKNTKESLDFIVIRIASVTNVNGSKTEETVFFCFFVVLPPQGQIGLTKLLDSEGQSICLLRLYYLSS